MDIGKDLQDAYECGRQDALNELMEYTYGMLTAEKFGLQHKIKSMMSDRKTENSSEKPNNCLPKRCETCKHRDKEWDDYPCDACCGANSHYESKDEPLTCDGNCWMKKQNGEWLCEHCQREPKTEPQIVRSNLE